MRDASKWARFNQFLCAAIPASDTADLLPILAEGWSDLTAARAAFVAIPAHAPDRFCGTYFCSGLTQTVELTGPNLSEWSAASVLRALREQTNVEPIASEGVVSLPFSLDGVSLGGVLLVRRERGRLQQTLCEDLSAVSARLIARLLSPVSATREASAIDSAALQAAKTAALAEFAAGAGHEINNPVATIAGRAELLLKDETDPERRHALTTIGGQAYRIRDMIGDLMLFARPPQPHPEPLDVQELIETVLANLAEIASDRQCDFVREFEQSGVPVLADRVQFCVAVSSLVRNSLDASTEGGKITVGTRLVAENSGRCWLLTVTDRGLGLSETDRQHLFDPFYSGRQAGRGLGFGLCKCWRIVTKHGGRIEVTSNPAEGTTRFEVYWPAVGEEGAQRI